VIVTRNGRAVTALLAVRDDEKSRTTGSGPLATPTSPLETSRQQIRETEGIGHEDFWAEMEEEEPGQGWRKSKKTAA